MKQNQYVTGYGAIFFQIGFYAVLKEIKSDLSVDWSGTPGFK